MRKNKCNMDTADTVQFLFYFFRIFTYVQLISTQFDERISQWRNPTKILCFLLLQRGDDAADANTRPPKTGDWGTEEWGGAEEWRGDGEYSRDSVTCNFNLGGERTHSKYPRKRSDSSWTVLTMPRNQFQNFAYMLKIVPVSQNSARA